MTSCKHSTPEYRNTIASVRPAKIAVLVDKQDKYWKYSILRIIEWCTGIWGGAYFLIVPTDHKTIDEEFWKILEKYSPDYVYSFHPTVSDLKDANPTEYEIIIKRWRDGLLKNHPDMSQESINEFMGREIDPAQRFESHTTDELSQEIKYRLAPFYSADQIVQERISSQPNVPFPLTDVTKIINHTDVKRVVIPEYSGDIDTELLIYSVFGKPPKGYEEKLKKNAIDVEYTAKEIPVQELVNISIERKVDLAEYRFREQLRKELKERGKKPVFPTEDFFGISPSATSMLKLGYYTLRDDRSSLDDDTVLLIVGDTIEDFCFYYSLSRLNTNVHWLPVEFLKQVELASRKKPFDKDKASVASSIIHAVYSKAHFGRAGGNVHLFSLSTDKKTLKKHKGVISKLLNDDVSEVEGAFLICENLDEHLKGILHVIEENNYANQHTETFVDGESVGTVPTPKPKNFKIVNPMEHRWITEVTIDGYTPPELVFLNESIVISGIQTYPTRVSRYGVCYVSPNIGYFGGDIDTNTMRPKLKMVDPMNIFKEMVKEAGYVDLVVSDKGGYSAISTEKFGSLDAIGSFLAQGKNRNLLDKFRSSPSNTPESGEVVPLGGRNYIDFKAVETALGSEREAVELIDDFLDKGIFTRGIPLQCNDCRNSEWYSLGEVSNEFQCKRCNRTQLVKHRNLHGAKEPQWFYKLDEVVYQGVDNNMHVPLLTLYNLKKGSKSFQYIHEADVIIGDKKIELDVCCIVDGKVIFGEGKKDSIKQKDVRKYVEFASKLKKYPDEVVFSTFAEDWSPEVKTFIAGNVAKSRILVKKDLIVEPPTTPTTTEIVGV